MEWELILSLVFFAFCAGTIDAAVGGGGLIQIPALMSALPQTAPATIFGTNKIASICGTGSAAFSFVRLRSVRSPPPQRLHPKFGTAAPHSLRHASDVTRLLLHGTFGIL